ncbi:deleted in malignant brain tumors 1 protein-like isoform X2 [Mizuhopecten yessoensis]|uniref:deleted in malignant brain tumors 1 protein-like isoform X2 n=1 Tax=Mizuhopecten yessoensis TaxID=6573 RepID=UPI000B45887B|nr:deleted in malignant brain tumors 1 protein-like isoform X2 [Mizuhopecten yessoensis]
MASHSQLLVAIFLFLYRYNAAQVDQDFDVRLENGLYNNSGRVGVYHDGQWGGICGDSWNYNDAIVVCRMIGYNNGTTVSRFPTSDSAWYELYGNQTEPSLVWMGGVQCTGTESSLADCPFNGLGNVNCNEYYGRAFVFCYDEDDTEVKVRLVDGTSNGTGHVEVHYSSIWGSVCYAGFYDREAEVVCRMLGYSNGVSYGDSFFYSTKLPIWMDRLQCNGTETNIADCPFGGWGQISSYMSIATALCYNDFQASDEQQGVRLMNDVSNTSGSVEIMYGGQWSIVCGKNWDDIEAGIVCRMLGYGNGTAQLYTSYMWESREGMKVKIHVNCVGSETSIYNCIFSDVHGYCNNYADGRAGVSCSGALATPIPTDITTRTDSPFAIRLENGLYNNSGRVGVYHDGQWGGVCDYFWNYNDANVACRMLGFSNGTITSRHYTLDSAWYEWFGNETDPDLIWMDNVKCSGMETSLSDCPFDGWGVENCNAYYRSGHAYVFCYDEDDTEVKVRLVDGTSDGAGHVEVHYSSIWGSVCWDGFYNNEAEVVCRMLGYSNGVAYGDSSFSFTKLPKWMEQIQCNGTETNIADCPFGGWGQISSTLGIATALCYNDLQASDEQQGVRLMNDVSNTSGSVEIMYGGQWSIVCGDNWDDIEAGIVCRMLGYGNGTAKSYTSYQRGSRADIKSKIHVNCMGSESSIYSCTLSDVQQYCNSYADGRAGVSCSRTLATPIPTDITTTTDSPFAIRLENGLYNNSGRVGVYHDGQWGGVCDYLWNYNDANVACRMLGFSNGTVTSRRYALDSAWYEWFGNETDPDLIWMYSVQCYGMETSLADCPFDGWGVGNCKSYYSSAYVFCYDEDDTEVNVRLVDGPSDGAGHVEVHYSSIWGSVCWDGFYNIEAEVVCRMLGYSNGVAYGDSSFLFTKLPTWMDWLQCNGTETNIADCPFGGWGQISSRLGIATALCYNDWQASDEQQGVRLMNDVSNTSGSVEIMYGGQWSIVCGNNWDDIEAGIVCRMLGYGNGTAQSYGSYYKVPREDMKVKIHVNCVGSETSLYNCRFSDVLRYCYMDGRAGVSCLGALAAVKTCSVLNSVTIVLINNLCRILSLM